VCTIYTKVIMYSGLGTLLSFSACYIKQTYVNCYLKESHNQLPMIYDNYSAQRLALGVELKYLDIHSETILK